MMVKMCIRIMICRDERDEGSGVPEVKVVVDQEEEQKWGKMILIEVSNAPRPFTVSRYVLMETTLELDEMFANRGD